MMLGFPIARRNLFMTFVVSVLLWGWIKLNTGYFLYHGRSYGLNRMSSKYLKRSTDTRKGYRTATERTITEQASHVALDHPYFSRRQTMLDACKGREFDHAFRGNKTDQGLRGNFVVDRKNRILYCAMEKVGSTFWRRLWQITSGLSSAKSPYDLNPGAALGGGQETLKNLAFDEIHTMFSTYRGFIITRHPLDRLFSGYVDKLFSPNPVFWQSIGTYIVTNFREGGNKLEKPCGNDVTFPEMVKYLIHSETHNTHRNGHFLPMYDHCRPCQIKYDIIAKMESFVDDTLYILKSLGFHDLYINLNKTMRAASVSDTITDQSNLLYAFKTKSCIHFYDSQRTMWRKFQIRGVISSSSKFPFSRRKSANVTKQEYITAVTDAIGDAKMPTVAMQYRKEAYFQAYSMVERADMEKLVQILRPDCDIFGYDCSLASLESDMEEYKSEIDYFDIKSA